MKELSDEIPAYFIAMEKKYYVPFHNKRAFSSFAQPVKLQNSPYVKSLKMQYF